MVIEFDTGTINLDQGYVKSKEGLETVDLDLIFRAICDL
jgi:hypothetical protein